MGQRTSDSFRNRTSHGMLPGKNFIKRDDNESLTYKTLVSSYGEAEYQVVSLPWRAELLSLFGENYEDDLKSSICVSCAV